MYLNVETIALLGVLWGLPLPSVTEAPPPGFALSTFSTGIEAQFVIPFDALRAVFDASRSEEKPK